MIRRFLPRAALAAALIACALPAAADFRFGVEMRNTSIDALEPLVASGTLTLHTGTEPAGGCTGAATGTTVATITVPADPWTTASNGSKALQGSWQDASADAAGTATYGRITQAGACRIQFGVTVTGGGGDVTLTDVTLEVGQQVTITAFSITAGGA